MFDSPIAKQIITELVTGSKNSAVLVAKVAGAHDCSVQSVYAVLRKLREQGIVLLNKKLLTLNIVWVEEQSELLKRARDTYLESTDSGTFSIETLEEGDRVTYQFKNPVLLDEMWGHTFMLLLNRIQKEIPIMIYNPHSWFPLVRYASEKTIFQSLFDNGFRAYFSFGGQEELDRDICKKFVEPIGHSYSTGVELGLKKEKYINVVGDYMIEVELDEAVAEAINKYFSKYKKIEHSDAKELQEIVSKRGKNKLTLSRNSHKAQRLRSRLAKDFLIPTLGRRFV